MHEGLNHWTFVIAAYAIGIAATAGLIGWSWTAMRRAEARRERSRGR
ncbi:MAG: heme exporter protein CcmD [Proteobacteria bacterium]|nr:heme exporter protein CcmD [Pseudomonadota bacterium]